MDSNRAYHPPCMLGLQQIGTQIVPLYQNREGKNPQKYYTSAWLSFCGESVKNTQHMCTADFFFFFKSAFNNHPHTFVPLGFSSYSDHRTIITASWTSINIFLGKIKYKSSFPHQCIIRWHRDVIWVNCLQSPKCKKGQVPKKPLTVCGVGDIQKTVSKKPLQPQHVRVRWWQPWLQACRASSPFGEHWWTDTASSAVVNICILSPPPPFCEYALTFVARIRRNLRILSIYANAG